MQDPRLTTSEFMEALALYREARNQSSAIKAAKLAVIRNRAAKRKDDTTAVIIQPFQFSSFNASDPNSKVWPDMLADPAEWPAWLDCCAVVQTPLMADPTNGATLYEDMPDGLTRPNWADPDKMTLHLGSTRFYRA